MAKTAEKPNIQTFSSFEEADEAERRERWAMTPLERLAIVEKLRSYQYPNGIAPRLQRVLETVKRKRS